MSKHDDYLTQCHEECQETVQTAKALTEDKIEPTLEQFQKNTLDNIPQHFGDFLYTAMGDRVTGQRSSVLNKTYLEDNHRGQEIAERAEVAGRTVEEHVRHEQKEWNSQPSYITRYRDHHQPQLWITTGRKFGVSYVTGKNGDRYHTIYFGAGQCFSHFTQEHVDCIKNKLKRQCAQSFLDFRNDFVDGVRELNNQLIPVDVPVELGVVSCITKTPKINPDSGSYNDDSTKKFTLIEDVVQDKITHVLTQINEPEVWDKKSDVRSSTASREHEHEPSFVSLIFLKIVPPEVTVSDDGKTSHEHGTISVIGNLDIGMDELASSVQTAERFEARQIINHLSDVPYNHYGITNYGALGAEYVHKYKEVPSQGVLLNLHQVLDDPTVKGELDKRVKFYNDMSDRLQRLKHENATLYFVNADL